MKTTTENITPAIARVLLEHNTSNRPIRNGHVETLRQAFERGEYVLTHQGIAFAKDGSLIDGQHRLTAISLLPDGSVFPMMVTRGLDRECVFPVVDATQAKRSASDALGISKALGETAGFFAKIFQGERIGMTPSYVSPFADWIAPEVETLMAFCPTTAKTWSAAPVKAACVLQMKDGQRDYALALYRALVTFDIDNVPPVARGMLKAWQAGNVRASAGAYDLFSKSLRMFNPKNRNLTVIRVDQSSLITEVRERLARDVMGIHKKMAPTIDRGAKSVSRRHFSLLNNAA